MMSRPWVVAGGGISGLVAARMLAAKASDRQVVLLEASDRLGGKIRTRRFDGAAIDAGADWFLSNDGVMLELCRELGCEEKLTEPRSMGALIWSGGIMQPLPPGFVRGIPTSLRALLTCSNLSYAGRLRALADLALSGPLTGPDVSVASVVRRRFGPELLERLVDPILAASRSGAPDRMSLGAATPDVDGVARSRRSVLLGLRDAAPARPSFRGLDGGMGLLIDALANDLEGVDVRTAARVVAVEETDDGYEIRLEDGSLAAGAVVLALPAPEAAGVLRALDSELSETISSVRYTSAAVVSLIYPPGAIHPPGSASGFIVPSSEGRLITAAAWYSAKWAGARPDDGSFVMRCFAGRAPNDFVLRLDEDDLVRRVAHELDLAIAPRAPHHTAFVDRWTHALPLFEVGHRERVDRIEEGIRRHPGLALAGAGYGGSGLPDCVAGGQAAAERILSH